MLAVLEVRLQLVQAQHGLAAELGVVAGYLQLGQHVAHDPGHGPQVGERDHGAVHRADLLLREPLCDARVAEGMFTVRGLEGEEGDAPVTRGRDHMPHGPSPPTINQQ